MRYVHLHPGSSFAINSCIMEFDKMNHQIRVCAMQGTQSFNDWVSGSRTCNGYLYKLNACNGAENMSSSEHIVAEEDTYYFIHYRLPSNASEVHLVMNISLSSLDYVVNASSRYACKASDSTYCSITHIPFTFKGLGIISTKISDDNTGIPTWSYEDTIAVSWQCSGSLKAYIILLCLPIFSVLCCCILCNICIVVCPRCNSRCSQQRVPSVQNQASSSPSIRFSIHGHLRLNSKHPLGLPRAYKMTHLLPSLEKLYEGN